MKASVLSNDQWFKVLKALAYSFGSGFVGGFTIATTGLLSTIGTSGITFSKATLIALVVAGVVGGLNTLAVFIKQLFTPTEIG